MRGNLARSSALLLVAFFATGCAAIHHSYVDPARRIPDEALRPAPAAPRPTLFVVYFQTNGKDRPAVAEQVLPKFVAALTRSGHLRKTGRGEAGDRIDITLNNVSDIGSAAGKGFGTGLTFGLAGSRVVDGYVMSVRCRGAGGRVVTKEYHHEIETTIGLKSAPAGKLEMPLDQAFDRVVDDLSRLLIRDLMQEGYFSEMPPPVAEPVTAPTPAPTIAPAAP